MHTTNINNSMTSIHSKLALLTSLRNSHFLSVLFPVLIVIFISGLSSCKSGRKLETGEARIKGRIVNPTRDFIELKERTSSKKDTIKLNEKGEFEIIFKPDTLREYTFVYGNESKPDTLFINSENQNLSVTYKSQELSLIIEKGFDMKLWVDTKDPSSSLSISGNGAEINDYMARKIMLGSEFNMHNARLLKSKPEEYLKFVNEYKTNLDKLVSGLPSKSPYLPEGFREKEAKNNYLTISRLKLNYAIEHLAGDGDASQFAPDETYFAFLKEIPYDNTEELMNPNYMLLISTYADYLSKKENLGKTLTREQWLAAKYETYKKIFHDPSTRDIVLFDFLKMSSKQFDTEWYKNAIEEFRITASSDSLKVELTKLRDTLE